MENGVWHSFYFSEIISSNSTLTAQFCSQNIPWSYKLHAGSSIQGWITAKLGMQTNFEYAPAFARVTSTQLRSDGRNKRLFCLLYRVKMRPRWISIRIILYWTYILWIYKQKQSKKHRVYISCALCERSHFRLRTSLQTHTFTFWINICSDKSLQFRLDLANSSKYCLYDC